MAVNGSAIVVDSLLRQGVDTVFGYPGGAVMPLYDALYDSPIKHVLTVHEQGAVHAADGYARSSGKVGVCIATSGPGATNLVTGLATAFTDSSPVVAITGQVSTWLLGRDVFQEIDITGITMPITKHNFLVKDVADLADIVAKAFAIASSGRPGPVLIDIPRDVLVGTIEVDAAKPIDSSGVSDNDCEFENDEVAEIAKAIKSAQRPIMLIGGGVKSAEAYTEMITLAELTGMPIVSTLMGLGAFPSEHPLYLGFSGMHGHKAHNYALCEADVVLAVGSRFSDRAIGDPGKYSAGKTVIHLDVDPSELDKNFFTTLRLGGCLQQSLLRLIEQLQGYTANDLSPWWSMIENWRQENPMAADEPGFSPQWIMRHMSQSTSEMPITWVTDVGQNQMWAAQHLTIRSPRAWITSGGLGTMGFGFPAGIGAQLACADRRVVVIAGDGGFKMTGMELSTAVNLGLPMICVIVNNNALGMVKQWQHVFFNKRYASSVLPPFNFEQFAVACGAAAWTTNTREEFASAFGKALATSGPAVVVANIRPDFLVTPMIIPGQTINQFVDI